MRKKSLFKHFVAGLIFIATMIGCGGAAKLYNVEQKTFEQVSTTPMKEAILKAGESLGWMMSNQNDNTIIGQISRKSYFAKIEIKYTHNSYSIHLLESENLSYDREKNTIRSGYNGWIINLENQIDSLINPLVMTPELKQQELLAQQDKKNLNNVKEDMEAERNRKIVKKTTIIQDVMNKKISKSLSIEEVEQAIYNAGKNNGWIMKKQETGFILAKKVIKKHTMVVRISYSKDDYSITYIASENLNYNNYYIHQNYNIWINHLENDIDFAVN